MLAYLMSRVGFRTYGLGFGFRDRLPGMENQTGKTMEVQWKLEGYRIL